jgi:hypothetical protein
MQTTSSLKFKKKKTGIRGYFDSEKFQKPETVYGISKIWNCSFWG